MHDREKPHCAIVAAKPTNKAGAPAAEPSAGTRPPIIDRFRARHPRVILRVDTASSPMFDNPGLRSRKYDLVLARLLMSCRSAAF